MAFLLKPIVCKLTQITEKIKSFLAFGLQIWPLIIFWVFLRSTKLKSLKFKSKLHIFAVKTVISSNLPKRISVAQ
jgi:hypothetical protein